MANIGESSIIRVQKDKNNPYVMMNKFVLNDARISFKAKGILAYLLSKPDNWQVRVIDLASKTIEGKASIYTGLKELKDYGYLEKYPVRIDGKIHHWESVVYETPRCVQNQYLENEEVVDNSQFDKNDVSDFKPRHLLTENQDVESVDIENREHNNNDLSNIDFNNKSINQSNETPKRKADLTDGLTESFSNPEDDKIVERILQNGNVEMYDARLFISQVISKLWKDRDLPYKLQMGLKTEDIQDRLRELKQVHIDSAIAKMQGCKKNKELYFMKCLLTAIVESPFNFEDEEDIE